VDPEVLALLRRVRGAGHPVGLLTNATSRLAYELEVLALTDEVDVVCNSWELGVAKPEAEAFIRAAARIGVPPQDCFFTDDRLENVAAAGQAGLAAHHFTAATALEAALIGAGLLSPRLSRDEQSVPVRQPLENPERPTG
jgi:putative hydrolase of the HAD superfamily